MSTPAKWEGQRLDELRRLYCVEGVGPSELVRRLGVTRSALSGVISRHKLKRAGGAASTAMGRRQGGIEAQRLRAKAKAEAASKSEPRPEPAPGPEEYTLRPDAWDPLPGARPVPFLDLKADHCRWPVDADGFAACGLPVTRGSYCETHAVMARPAPKPVGT